jgi:hypothetical protein
LRHFKWLMLCPYYSITSTIELRSKLGCQQGREL